ncbi:MAG: hypothetical protein AB2556_22475 [Candidatus Thiodiazotropha sp.]
MKDSILEASGKNIKKAKDVRKATVKKHIRHEQFKEALFEKETFRHGMDVLRSERHRIYGQYLNKVSLSPFGYKRWIAGNGHQDATNEVGIDKVDAISQQEMDTYIEELLGG